MNMIDCERSIEGRDGEVAEIGRSVCEFGYSNLSQLDGNPGNSNSGQGPLNTRSPEQSQIPSLQA